MTDDLVLRFITARDPEFVEARGLRHAVLYEPLGIAERDVDWGDDLGSRHCVAFLRGEMVGYGRLVSGHGGTQIRHLAVLPRRRGAGIGARLLGELVDAARDSGAPSVYLNARFTSLGMYRARGFRATGPIFHTESTHLPHQRMELALG